MQDEELKELYTACKKKACAIFNKSAVGEVKEQYFTSLKEKM